MLSVQKTTLTNFNICHVNFGKKSLKLQTASFNINLKYFLTLILQSYLALPSSHLLIQTWGPRREAKTGCKM